MRWLHRIASVSSLVGLALFGRFDDRNTCWAQQANNNNNNVGVRGGMAGNRGVPAAPIRGINPLANGNIDLNAAFRGQNVPPVFNPTATTVNSYPLQPGNPYTPLVMAPNATPGLAASNPFQPPYSPFGTHLFNATNQFNPYQVNPYVLNAMYSQLYNPYVNNPLLMLQMNQLLLGQLGMYGIDPLSGAGVPVGNFNNRNAGMNAGGNNLVPGLNMGNAGNPGGGN